jgi:hypothetical protein
MYHKSLIDVVQRDDYCLIVGSRIHYIWLHFQGHQKMKKMMRKTDG